MQATSLLGRDRLFIYIASLAMGAALGVGQARAQDPNLKPAYGSVTLNAGFLPDPFSKTLTAGGSIKTELGGVKAFVAKAPDFRLDYKAGSYPLKIYVESKGDTTLLVRLPNGTWVANNDGNIGTNPLLSFAKPQSGRYDIWVGTIGAKTVGATLHISELSNVPKTNPTKILENRLPATVDLRPKFKKLGLVARDQARTGGSDVCSLFAITALADFELASKDPNSPRLSEEFLVWAANEATGLKGDQAMFYEAVHGLNALGICSDALMPFASGGNPKPPSAKALADAKQRSARWKVEWIKRWDVKQPLTDQEFEAIKRALANGHPVAVGMRWQKSGPVNLLDVAVEVFDGHSVVFVGYEQDAKKPGGGVFIFRNHGGPRFGSDGHGTISYAYARAYVNDALWLKCGAAGSETPRERIEAEAMTVLTALKCRANPQKMDPFGKKMWSGGVQLFCGAEKGGHVELGFKVSKAGRYRVRLLGTAGPDFGTISVTLNGKKIAADFDLYSGRVCPAGSLELGNWDLAAGSQHRLRVASVSKHPVSGNYYFGLDALDLLVAD